ncbi:MULTISPECIES: hypothetical protein [Pseudomonas]|uniref:Uncharacterized protein n=1 Tax=Pseudomonas fluorescens TaxID=294 RepID=A0A7Z3C557_PSEFL|nr:MULTISPECIES: hypothetical protein [Pseudomonas]QJP95691.1 hypothetical protein C6Y56_14260 [Pseudomonas fluorescens]
MTVLLKKILIRLGAAIGVAIALSAVMLFVCTNVPMVWRSIFPNDTLETVDKSKVVKKAMLGEACNKENSTCKKNVLIILGAIDDGTVKAIEQLAEKETFDTVCFGSPGGSAGVATRIGRWIKSNNLNTCMAEHYKLEGGIDVSNVECQSACPYLLVMGKTRTALGSDFNIGVHSSGVPLDFCVCRFKVNEFWPYVSTSDYRKMLEGSDEAEIHLRLLSDSLEVDSTSIHRLTQSELEKYAVFNAYGAVDPSAR